VRDNDQIDAAMALANRSVRRDPRHRFGFVAPQKYANGSPSRHQARKPNSTDDALPTAHGSLISLAA
jgi:hypothetical protein